MTGSTMKNFIIIIITGLKRLRMLGWRCILIMPWFVITACSEPKPQYYKTHPHELQLALQQHCLKPKELTSDYCVNLMKIAEHINQLIYELQLSPQLFGQNLLQLQMILAKQMQQPNSLSKIKKIQDDLEERLAIVQWLESPETKS